MPSPLTRRRAFALAGAAAAVSVLRPEPAAASFTRAAPLTGAPQRVPRFDLIGLDGPGELRTRLGDGRWTPWIHVHDATQPVWTGPSDTFQVRSHRARRVRLTRTGPAPRVAARAARQAQASAQPAIITRAQWGGDQLPPKQDPIYGTVQVGFVHHTVTANTYAPQDSAGIVLGICRYHRDHNGWNDIGYQFLVDKYGQVFEGRAGGVDLAVVGAQAQGYNSASTGVSCLGDYTSGALTEAGVAAVAQLLAWKLSLHGVPTTGEVTVVSQGGETNRYPAGRPVTLQRISGHRDGDATSCPGEALYAQLDDIRARATAQAAPLSSLTIAAANTRLQYPDTALALTGTLRYADGASPAGEPVTVEYQTKAGRAWTPVAGTTADPAGAFAVSVPLPGAGRVRASQSTLRSSPVAVTVLPRLALSVRPRSFTATAEPRTVTRGTIVVTRRVRHGWVRVRRIPVTFVDGTATVPFRPPLRGRYRVTLSAAKGSVRRPLIVRA